MMDSAGGLASRGGQRLRVICCLVLGAAGWVLPAAGVVAGDADTPQTKRILVLPALQWNATASTWQYAALQKVGQLPTAMAGLRFGMTPEQVGEHLPDRSSALHWEDLPQAKEFVQDVRYVWMPMRAGETLLSPVTGCFGKPSYIVLLFYEKALFRISWRFLPDPQCRDPHAAAEDLYASFVPVAPSVVISSHYVAGFAEVVDVTDPAVPPLLRSVRWQMQGQ